MTDALPEAGSISITLKHRGKYEDPWFVFHGSPLAVKGQIAEVFGIEGADGYSVAELAYEADTLSRAAYALARDAGARPVPKAKKKATAPEKGTQGDTEVPKGKPEADEPKSKPEADEPDLYALVEAAQSKAALTTLWKKHRAAFDADGDLMSAWKTKGRSL